MFRLVCRNATKLLKRKDSSGAILKDGQLKPADYSHSLSLKNVRIFSNQLFSFKFNSVVAYKIFLGNAETW